MEIDLKEILGISNNFLDFYSVVDGFRNVGLISFQKFHNIDTQSFLQFRPNSRKNGPNLSTYILELIDFYDTKRV